MTTVDKSKVSQTSGKDEGPKENGFFNRPRAGGKSIWDWMQLLLIPVILVIVGSYFSYQQTQTSLYVSQQQHQQDQASTLDQQRATILQTYIDNIQDLLLNHNLLKSSSLNTDNPYYDVAILARARTLTALQGLDPVRKGRLVQFIYEAKLIVSKLLIRNNLNDPIINLDGADLSNVNLSNAFLNLADLGGVILLNANFTKADLIGAYLAQADFTKADLSGAYLSGAYLAQADFTKADLSSANLGGAYLSGVDLSSANLDGAYLDGVDLSGAKYLTQKQLDQVFTCKGAILPPGLTCHHNQ